MDILDIFYNYVIKEASTGRINCFMYYNVLFETYIKEDNIKIECPIKYNNVVVPVLIIRNKENFNTLLIYYVEKAKIFYDNTNYKEEQLNGEYYDKYRVCPEKVIMSRLWSIDTYEDFEEPEKFLKRRIAFLESDLGESKKEFSYSDKLDGNITLSIEKDKIDYETPYKMVINSINESGSIYKFPEIKFGIDGDIVYIYAIQNKDNRTNKYIKYMNRILYKIGEGFDSYEDNFDMYEEGNLRDVSASFVVALNMAISYFNSLGYSKFCAPSFLVTRWNAKRIMAERNSIKNPYEDVFELYDAIDSHERLQSNLTEKFLRTFLRLTHHYDNLTVDSYPFDNHIDSNLYLSVNGELISNNGLLNETANIVKSNNKSKNI